MRAAEVDALIVGAGPVGLTAAAALTHHGLTCRIIDKTSAPSDKSKALAVWCRTMELLDGLELAETFVRSGNKLTGGSIYVEGKRLVHLALTSDESPFGFPLMIPQYDTERLLTEHLAERGVIVERPVELVGFHDATDRVTCALRHANGREERLEVPWLIGCDGAHSIVRHALGMEFAGSAEPNDWMLADARLAGVLAADEVTVFWHEQGVLAFFPMNGERFRMIADLGPSADEPRAEPTLADAQAIIDQRGPGGITLSDPVWLANFKINERKVTEYHRGRVLLAGDAAHIHSPAGGQGMNTGMQDAFNLAWKVALVQRGLGREEPLLTSYSLERSAVGDQVLKDAARFTALATLRHPVAQWVRNHLAPILTSFDAVHDKIRDKWFELSVNYRQSPLSVDRLRHRGSLLAGDRLGDAPLIGADDGLPTTLFHVVRGAGHVMLLLPGGNAEGVDALLRIAAVAASTLAAELEPHLIVPARTMLADLKLGDQPVPVWLDAENRLHQRLHAEEPTVVVVRPDGYLSYRGPASDEAALLGHLGGYLMARTRGDRGDVCLPRQTAMAAN